MNLKPDYIPKPKTLERKIFIDFNLDILFKNLNLDMLFLRFFNLKKSETEKIKNTLTELEELKNEIIENKYIKANGIYKIFRIKNYGGYIDIIEDEKVIGNIEFKKTQKSFSISDFLNDDDFVALASTSIFFNEEVKNKMLEKRDFKKLYIINSISIMLAESFIELLHYFVIRNFKNEDENNFSKFVEYIKTTKRFSPGYPSIDIKFNQTIHNLLKASEIGSRITESYMIEPESSVQAIILHNPKAFYI